MRQEPLDAIIAFADAGQRSWLFRVLDILTGKWATEDLPEECGVLLNTQLMFLKEKDPTTKLFDDNEWIRSLTDTQAVAADIPEERMTHSPHARGGPKKGSAHPDGGVRDSWHSVKEGELAALTAVMRQLMPKDRGAEQGDVDGPLECIHSGIGDGRS